MGIYDSTNVSHQVRILGKQEHKGNAQGDATTTTIHCADSRYLTSLVPSWPNWQKSPTTALHKPSQSTEVIIL